MSPETEDNHSTTSKETQSSRRINRLSWTALGAILGIGTTALVLTVMDQQVAQPVAIMRISEPQNGQTVNSHIITVRGTITDLRSNEGETGWVFVTDVGDKVRHPQAGAVELIAGTDRWERIGVRLGSEADQDKGYCIVPAVADQIGTRVLNDYMERGRQTNHYPGFSSLPQGVYRQDQEVCVRR